ncbi:hypothetical protein GGS26DRAFT_576659 [Hypomontagnella submonticulosa]|nr:hypothetical protein GGS26DRAFT_576659 [Hypomontagnella submonticulosa]
MIPSLSQPATQSALLAWADSIIRKLHPKPDPALSVKKPEDLFDGTVYSALLEAIDLKYDPSRFQQSFAASLAEGDESRGRRRNLHSIHMGLKDFASRECTKIEPLLNQVDFQAVAKEPTREGVLQILILFVSATIFRDDNNVPYIKLLHELANAQPQLILIITELQNKLGVADAKAKTDDSGPVLDHDIENPDDELAQEAAIAKLQHERDEAKGTAGNLKIRLDRLQDNYDELLRKLAEVQEDNDGLKKQLESEAGNFDKHRLQRQLKENEILIANLENERNALVEERDRLLKEKARLELVAQKAEALTDENQELRSKNEDLSKKANMADNLRKKLESMKQLEAELKRLQNEKVDATRLLEQLDSATMRIETLKREAEAYATKMEGYEIDIAEFRNQKAIFTTENTDLKLRLEELQNRSQIDEAVVRELQEKVLMMGEPSSSSTPDTPQGYHPTSLEDELNESVNAMSMRNLEVKRLQAENSILKSSIGTETEKGQLIQQIEDIRASRQAIQDKYDEILEKYTVGQHQLDAFIQNMGQDGEEAYSNLRTQVLAEQNRTKQLERELSTAKEQLADRDRALLEARGDLNAVEKESLDALAELKNTDGMLAVSLRAELEAERKKHKALQDQFEAQRSQLLTAFIEKDQLRREAEAANREMQRAADGLTINTDTAKQSEKMEKLRTRYKQLQQQYEQSELKSRELERTLKAVRAGSEAGAQKAQTDQIIKNLQRENAMITTAWYDLTSRLQSNHVVLQRRHDVPKSWLNKQRQMVNATPRK